MADDLPPPPPDRPGEEPSDSSPPGASDATAAPAPEPEVPPVAVPPAPPVSDDELTAAAPSARVAVPPPPVTGDEASAAVPLASSPATSAIATPPVAPPVAAHEVGAFPPPVTPASSAAPPAAPRRRRGVMVALIVVAVVVVALIVVGVILAVSSDDSSDESYSLDAAFQNASDASTLQYDMSLDAGGESVLDVSGAVDGDVSSLQLDLGAIVGNDVFAGNEVHVINDAGGGVLYIQADELIPKTPLNFLLPDFGWLAVDYGELPGGDAFAGALSGDPLELIDAIGADASDATDLGQETIDGVDTRHYQFTVDVADALESTKAISGLVGDLGLDLGPSDGALGEATYDVWVTADNEIRRAQLAFSIGDRDVSLVIDIVSFGDGSDIEVPSGDDVFNLSELLGS
jgi:hypothetical protein